MVLYYKITHRKRILYTILAITASSILNSGLNFISHVLELPIFIDSIFTVMTAALFGLVPGILVGFFSNVLMELTQGMPGYMIIFSIVNITTGLITALLVRKGFFDDPVGALWLLLILTLSNAFLGALIVTMIFGGVTYEPVDNIVRAIVITGQSIFTSAFFARILINFVDKGIAVLLTYPLYNWIKTRKEGVKKESSLNS